MALSYQWYKDGVAIQGATSATYSKASAAVSDKGSYYCKVSNDYGSVNSAPATVDVLAYKIGYFAGTNVTTNENDFVTQWSDTNNLNPLTETAKIDSLPVVNDGIYFTDDGLTIPNNVSGFGADTWSVVINCTPIALHGVTGYVYSDAIFRVDFTDYIRGDMLVVYISTGGLFNIAYFEDGVGWTVGDSNTYATLGSSVKLTIIHDGNNVVKLYSGQTLVSSITITGDSTQPVGWSIGGPSTKLEYSSTSHIAELKVASMRIYDEELTPEQIAYA